MKLSTKGRYGLRAMVDLAVHETEGPVSIQSIADRQELSEKYLEQLLGMPYPIMGKVVHGNRIGRKILRNQNF